MRPVVIIVAAGLAAVTACSSSSTTAGTAGSPGTSPGSPGTSPGAAASLSGSLTVFAAASLQEAFTTIGKQFEAAHPGVKVTWVRLFWSDWAGGGSVLGCVRGAPAHE